MFYSHTQARAKLPKTRQRVVPVEAVRPKGPPSGAVPGRAAWKRDGVIAGGGPMGNTPIALTPTVVRNRLPDVSEATKIIGNDFWNRLFQLLLVHLDHSCFINFRVMVKYFFWGGWGRRGQSDKPFKRQTSWRQTLIAYDRVFAAFVVFNILIYATTLVDPIVSVSEAGRMYTYLR